MRIGLILFDMDGVIVDSMRHHAECWIEVLGKQGLVVDVFDIYKREGMSGRDSVVDLYREHGIPFPGDDVFADMLSRKLSLFDRRKIRLFPVVEEMLMFLRGRGVSLALVTGSLRRSVTRVLPRKIMRLFQAVVTADDVLNGKPHPEPYLTALHKIGVDPETALVVENAPQGIQAAVDAGIECYALETTLPAEYLQGAARIFKDHRTLLRYFRTMLH